MAGRSLLFWGRRTVLELLSVISSFRPKLSPTLVQSSGFSLTFSLMFATGITSTRTSHSPTKIILRSMLYWRSFPMQSISSVTGM